MHPPAFNVHHHRLSDWPDCFLELQCHSPRCRGRKSQPSVKLLLSRHGNPLFYDLLRRLRCEQCHQRPAPVYLLADHHREFCYGGPPGWALELVPVPRA